MPPQIKKLYITVTNESYFGEKVRCYSFFVVNCWSVPGDAKLNPRSVKPSLHRHSKDPIELIQVELFEQVRLKRHSSMSSQPPPSLFALG